MNNGLDIINYKNSSNAAIDYKNLDDEMLEEEAGREQKKRVDMIQVMRKKKK